MSLIASIIIVAILLHQKVGFIGIQTRLWAKSDDDGDSGGDDDDDDCVNNVDENWETHTLVKLRDP